MILLDTDHLIVLKYPDSPRHAALLERLEASADPQIGTTIISDEEQWRGWLAVVSRGCQVEHQVQACQELLGRLDFMSRWTVLPFDAAAAAEFERLRDAGVGIATMDLKIASIALARGALLLSANLRDFKGVPGLRVENWLD